MTEDTEYWAGATWVYHSSITNDADGSGTISVEVTPGVGNEIEVLYGSVLNGDTASRAVKVEILDASGGNIIGSLVGSETVVAGGRVHFPAADGLSVNNGIAAGTRLIVSGVMIVRLAVEAVAVSQDATFGIAARIRGAVPTVTETGNGTSPTITINTEQVF